MVYDRTTFILANTFADGPFPSSVTFKGDFSIVNDSFNHLNMTLNKVELNFETFSGRKPKFSKQYWRYIFDHGEATLRTLRIIKYQIEDFIIPNYLGAALTQEVRPLTEFKVVGCEVKEVKERAFKNFTQLEVLDLSDNHLTTLPENVFSRNINLQKILLANNQISFLTKTIFDGLPNLLLINLRKNKLTAVPAIPRHTNRRFQPMVYLMADNSIHCRCSLIWVLHELTFHHNLEIEATCSDPTMVRGMPIIEGFTRMDKEACYRMALAARKEDVIESSQQQQLATSEVVASAAATAAAITDVQAATAASVADKSSATNEEQANQSAQALALAPASSGAAEQSSSVVEFAQPKPEAAAAATLESLINSAAAAAAVPIGQLAPVSPVDSMASEPKTQSQLVSVIPQTVLAPAQSAIPAVSIVSIAAPSSSGIGSVGEHKSSQHQDSPTVPQQQ